MGGVKDAIMNLFKTNTTKDYINQHVSIMCMEVGKKKRKLKIKKESESGNNIIKDVRSLFRLKRK